MPVGRNHGQNNQEGKLTPQFSQWGQEYLAGMPLLIDQPEAIGGRSAGGRPFGGTVGGMATRSASLLPLVSEGGYWGDLPQSEQPTVDAEQPWDRP